MTPQMQRGIDRALTVLDGPVEPVRPGLKSTRILRLLAERRPDGLLTAGVVGWLAGLAARDAQRTLDRLVRVGAVSRMTVAGQPADRQHVYFLDALQHSRFRIQTEGAGLPDALGAADISDLAEKLHFLERLRTREALGADPVMRRILDDYSAASRIALARLAHEAEAGRAAPAGQGVRRRDLPAQDNKGDRCIASIAADVGGKNGG